MLPVPYSNNAMKWLAKGLFLALVSFLLLPSAGLAASPTYYTITTSAGANGAISPTNPSVLRGNNQTFAITPNDCYRVNTVTVDGSSVGAVTSYTFSNVRATHTISATFIADGPFTLTSSAGAGGTITASGSVSCNGSKTFTITPNTCYVVSSVLVDGVSVGAVTTYTFSNVKAAHTISATFAAAGSFTITSSAGAGGTITASGSVSCNGSKTFTITPNTCYAVSSVLVDGVSVGAVTTYTFNNVTAAHTITATFITAGTNTLTATAGAGGAISPASATVTCAGSQTYTLTPATCMKVNTVTDNGTPVTVTGNTFTISNITTNHTLAATFTAANSLTLTATAGAGGTISPTSVTIACGSSQTFTIIPDAGYTVASASVDGTAIAIPAIGGLYSFTNVTANHTLAVTFTRQAFTITASAGTGGTISPSGTVTANYGDIPSFTLTPSAGYSVDKVQVDSSYINISGNTYQFPPVNANHTILALFKSSGGGGGQGGSSFISGCAASTYTGYSSGFNAADFSMANTAVTSGQIVLQTGAQAINPNSIIIPYTQEVYVNFLYINAGYVSDMGWLKYSDCVDASGNFLGWNAIPLSKRHPLFIRIQDCCNGGDGILDSNYGNGSFPTSSESALSTYDDGTGYRFIVDGDGAETPKDMKKSMGVIAGGTEIVFFLTANHRWNDPTPMSPDPGQITYFTKQAWNPDRYVANYPSSNYTYPQLFNRVYNLGNANSTLDCTWSNSTYYNPINRNPSSCSDPDLLSNGWLDGTAVTRINTYFGITLTGAVTIPVTPNQSFPHVIVGAPPNDPNQWVLGYEDWSGGGDYDINDLVFRIQRQTGGSAQTTSAISSLDPNAYFTAVTLEVYDNMPCSGKTNITYSLSIDGGLTWTEITSWDVVKTFSGSSVGSVVSNWTPGSPAQTYRMRTVDFSGNSTAGNKLLWKAQMTSTDEACAPAIINAALSGSMASHSFFSRASPSVQTNVLYSGSYETPDASWTDKSFRGHLYASRLYDPAVPGTQNIQSLWDAGAVLNAMSPGSRTIYYPDITPHVVTHEVVGTGDGAKKQFSGTLANHPISATTVLITDQTEKFVDKHTDALVGNLGGTGAINRFTGVFNLTFNNPPGSGVPVVAQYTYYTAASALKPFTTTNVTNAMLGLDDSYYIDSSGYHYYFDLNKSCALTDANCAITAADGAWLVNWVRGYKDGVSTKKEWLLGPIDHSVPAVQTPPGTPAWYYGTAVTKDERTAFDNFVIANWERPTLVYVGSRDGMLHAFDAGQFRWGYMDGGFFKWGDNPATSSIIEYRGYFKWTGGTSGSADYGTGAEKWAFIPANLISRFKNNLLSGDDQAYVDASPAISDVEIGSAWKTILLSAEGNGGDTVFCLDVTDPLSPTFLWEFADPELFRSRSSPAVAVIGRTLYNGTKTWVAFFVSGKTYNNTLCPSIYMIDVATGNLLKRIFLDSSPGSGCSNSSPSPSIPCPCPCGQGGVPSGQPALVDSDGNGYIDRMYIGTDKGYLYKVNIPDDPGSGSGEITNSVINTDFSDNYGSSIAVNQQYHPIYASPAVVVQNTYSAAGDIQYKIKILFGTSDSPFYDENINIANTTYDFFAYVDTAPKGDCNSGNVYLDWLYALPAGERIYASAFAAAGSIYFGTATSETEDPCSGAGNPASNSGKLYAMDITPSGTSVTPKLTVNTGNILSAPVVDDQHLYVKTVGNGLMTTPGPYNNPVVMGGLVQTTISTWREIFGKDQSLVPAP